MTASERYNVLSNLFNLHIYPSLEAKAKDDRMSTKRQKDILTGKLEILRQQEDLIDVSDLCQKSIESGRLCDKVNLMETEKSTLSRQITQLRMKLKDIPDIDSIDIDLYGYKHVDMIPKDLIHIIGDDYEFVPPESVSTEIDISLPPKLQHCPKKMIINHNLKEVIQHINTCKKAMSSGVDIAGLITDLESAAPIDSSMRLKILRALHAYASVSTDSMEDLIRWIKIESDVKSAMQHNVDVDEIQKSNIKIRKDIEVFNHEVCRRLSYLNINYNIKTSKAIVALDVQLSNLQKQLTKNKAKFMVLSLEVSEMEGKVKKNARISDCVNDVELELNIVHQELDLLDTYIKIVGRDGMQNLIISDRLKNIKLHVNRILTDMTNYTIDLRSDGNSKVEIVVIKNDTMMTISQLSGYEQFIMNIAIKCALNQCTYGNKSKIFAIDEGLDVIDDENFERLTLLFDYLRSRYEKIFVITHIHDIYDHVDSVIEVSTLHRSGL
jgi:DNA repair exonuclease SbcCD ATPase subunit